MLMHAEAGKRAHSFTRNPFVGRLLTGVALAGALLTANMGCRERTDDENISHFSSVIRVDPQNAFAYYWRAHAYAHKGDYEQAIADLSTVIRLDPKNAGYYYFKRGNVYYQKSDDTLALADYSAAIRFDPGFADAYHNRALAYSNLGHDSLAGQDRQTYERLKGQK